MRNISELKNTKDYSLLTHDEIVMLINYFYLLGQVRGLEVAVNELSGGVYHVEKEQPV